MTRRSARILLILAIVGSSVAGAVAMVAMKPEPTKKAPELLDPLVETLVLEAVRTRFTVRSQGTVRPRTETVLSAEVSGTITDISPKFVAGGVFEPGETLLRIDPTNYRVALEQAEALVEQRRIEYDGAKKLLSQGYRAQSEYASAAAALASARAELTRANRDLERTDIRLPYAGMVRAKETDLGQFVNPGSRLGVVFATDFAEVRLPLTDEDLAFVELPGFDAVTAEGSAGGPEVTLSAVQKGRMREWPARIVRTEGVVDEASRVTYAVARVEDPYRLDSSGAPLPMGTFVAASIVGTEVNDALRVPREILRGADELIFVDDDDRLRIRQVDVIRADADFAWIGDGARAGERVLLTALEAPVNGMAVRTGAAGNARIASSEESDSGE